MDILARQDRAFKDVPRRDLAFMPVVLCRAKP